MAPTPAAGAAGWHPTAARQYRIRAGDPAAEVRRVAAGRADSAIEALRGAALPGAGRDARAEAVHAARKDMKKLRSLLRLVRPALGEEPYRRENARYRDAARRLSADRDAEIRFEAAVDLLRRFPGEHPAGTEELMRRLEAGRAGDEPAGGAGGETPIEAAAAIEAGREEVPRWPLGGLREETFRRGVARAAARGRRALRAVEADPSGPRVHEWRKRVKDLWYMARLLRDRWPGPGPPPVAAADRLADLLGQHQDLAVLSGWLAGPAATAAPPPPARHLIELSRLRREEILGEAIPAGRRLYD